jgi:hypothetical protein
MLCELKNYRHSSGANLLTLMLHVTFNIVGICARGSYAQTGSLNYIIIALYFLLASHYRIKHLKKSGHYKFVLEFIVICGCIQKFPDWPPGARTANIMALCH